MVSINSFSSLGLRNSTLKTKLGLLSLVITTAVSVVSFSDVSATSIPIDRNLLQQQNLDYGLSSYQSFVREASNNYVVKRSLLSRNVLEGGSVGVNSVTIIAPQDVNYVLSDDLGQSSNDTVVHNTRKRMYYFSEYSNRNDVYGATTLKNTDGSPLQDADGNVITRDDYNDDIYTEVKNSLVLFSYQNPYLVSDPDIEFATDNIEGNRLFENPRVGLAVYDNDDEVYPVLQQSEFYKSLLAQYGNDLRLIVEVSNGIDAPNHFTGHKNGGVFLDLNANFRLLEYRLDDNRYLGYNKKSQDGAILSNPNPGDIADNGEYGQNYNQAAYFDALRMYIAQNSLYILTELTDGQYFKLQVVPNSEVTAEGFQNYNDLDNDNNGLDAPDYYLKSVRVDTQGAVVLYDMQYKGDIIIDSFAIENAVSFFGGDVLDASQDNSIRIRFTEEVSALTSTESHSNEMLFESVGSDAELVLDLQKGFSSRVYSTISAYKDNFYGNDSYSGLGDTTIAVVSQDGHQGVKGRIAFYRGGVGDDTIYVSGEDNKIVFSGNAGVLYDEDERDTLQENDAQGKVLNDKFLNLNNTLYQVNDKDGMPTVLDLNVDDAFDSNGYHSFLTGYQGRGNDQVIINNGSEVYFDGIISDYVLEDGQSNQVDAKEFGHSFTLLLQDDRSDANDSDVITFTAMRALRLNYKSLISILVDGSNEGDKIDGKKVELVIGVLDNDAALTAAQNEYDNSGIYLGYDIHTGERVPIDRSLDIKVLGYKHTNNEYSSEARINRIVFTNTNRAFGQGSTNINIFVETKLVMEARDSYSVSSAAPEGEDHFLDSYAIAPSLADQILGRYADYDAGHHGEVDLDLANSNLNINLVQEGVMELYGSIASFGTLAFDFDVEDNAAMIFYNQEVLAGNGNTGVRFYNQILGSNREDVITVNSNEGIRFSRSTADMNTDRVDNVGVRVSDPVIDLGNGDDRFETSVYNPVVTYNAMDDSGEDTVIDDDFISIVDGGEGYDTLLLNADFTSDDITVLTDQATSVNPYLQTKFINFEQVVVADGKSFYVTEDLFADDDSQSTNLSGINAISLGQNSRVIFEGHDSISSGIYVSSNNSGLDSELFIVENYEVNLDFDIYENLVGVDVDSNSVIVGYVNTVRLEGTIAYVNSNIPTHISQIVLTDESLLVFASDINDITRTNRLVVNADIIGSNGSNISVGDGINVDQVSFYESVSGINEFRVKENALVDIVDHNQSRTRSSNYEFQVKDLLLEDSSNLSLNSSNVLINDIEIHSGARLDLQVGANIGRIIFENDLVAETVVSINNRNYITEVFIDDIQLYENAKIIFESGAYVNNDELTTVKGDGLVQFDGSLVWNVNLLEGRSNISLASHAGHTGSLSTQMSAVFENDALWQDQDYVNNIEGVNFNVLYSSLNTVNFIGDLGIGNIQEGERGAILALLNDYNINGELSVNGGLVIGSDATINVNSGATFEAGSYLGYQVAYDSDNAQFNIGQLIFNGTVNGETNIILGAPNHIAWNALTEEQRPNVFSYNDSIIEFTNPVSVQVARELVNKVQNYGDNYYDVRLTYNYNASDANLVDSIGVDTTNIVYLDSEALLSYTGDVQTLIDNELIKDRDNNVEENYVEPALDLLRDLQSFRTGINNELFDQYRRGGINTQERRAVVAKITGDLNQNAQAPIAGFSYKSVSQISQRMIKLFDGDQTGVSAGEDYIDDTLRRNVWAKYTYSRTQQKRVDYSAPYSSTSIGSVIGYDYVRYNDDEKQAVLGVALSAGKFDTDPFTSKDDNEISGNATSSSNSYAVYGYTAYSYKQFAFDIVLGYGIFDYNSSRLVDTYTATGTSKGHFWSGKFGFTYDIAEQFENINYNLSSFDLTLYMAYNNVSLDPYSETGAEAANLRVANDDNIFYRTGAEISVSKSFERDSLLFTPYIKLGAGYYLSKDIGYEIGLESGGFGQHRFQIADVAGISVMVAAGFNFSFNENKYIDFDFSYENIDQSQLVTYDISAKFGYKF